MVKKRVIVLLSALLAVGTIICLLAFPYAANNDPFDLRNFLTSVTIQDGAGNAVKTGGTVNTGERYSFTLAFAEKADLQFAYNSGNALVCQLPADVSIPTASSGQTINSDSGKKIGTYSVTTGGLISVVFDNVKTDGTPTPGNQNFIDYYTSAAFSLQFQAQFAVVGGPKEIAFGNGQSTSLKVQAPPAGQAAVTTTASYDPATEMVRYAIEITAQGGAISDLVVSNAMTNGRWTFEKSDEPGIAPYAANQFAVKFDGQALPAYSSVPWNPAGGQDLRFDFTGKTLSAGRKITIEYTISLASYLSDRSVNRADYDIGTLYNNLTVNGKYNGTAAPQVSHTTKTAVNRKFIELAGESTMEADGNYIIWNGTWVGDGKELLNGAVITDTAKNGLSFPAGTKVKVMLYNLTGGQLTARAPITYSLGASGPMTVTATGFTYTVPASGQGDVYRAAFEFATLVPESAQKKTYENTLSLAKGGVTRSATKAMEIETGFMLLNEAFEPVEITVEKNVNGTAPNGSVFTFKLTQLKSDNVNDIMPGGLVVTKSRTGPGSVTFTEITSLPDGTYHFRVEEINGGVAGWTYDTTPRLITVVINQGKVTVGDMQIYWTSGTTLPLPYPSGNKLLWLNQSLPFQQTRHPDREADIGAMWLTDSANNVVIGTVYCVDAEIYAISGTPNYQPAPGTYINKQEILWVVGNGFWADGKPSMTSGVTTWAGTNNITWMSAKYNLPGLTQAEAYAATQAAVWYFSNPDLRAVLQPNGTDPSHTRIVSLFNQLIAGATSKPVLSPAIAVNFDTSAATRTGNYYGPVKVTVTQNPAGFTTSVPITLTAEPGFTLSSNTSGGAVPSTVTSGYQFYVNVGSANPAPTTPLVKGTASATVRSGGRTQDAQMFFFDNSGTDTQPVCGIGVASDGNITVKSTAVLCADGGTNVIVITNKYVSPDVTFNIYANKAVTGDAAPSDAQFTFVLTQLNSSNKNDVKAGGITQTRTRTGPGLVTFGPFTVSQAGTYYFKVEETNSGAAGWEYDTNSYVIEVIVQGSPLEARVIYPGSTGGVVFGTGNSQTSHATQFNAPVSGKRYKVTAQHNNWAIFEIADENDSTNTYYTVCGFLGISAPTAAELSKYGLSPATIGNIRYQVSASRNDRESTLAYALESVLYGAKMSLAEFNKFFGLNYTEQRRYEVLQAAVWFFEFRELYPTYNWSMTNASLWPQYLPEAPGSSVMVNHGLRDFVTSRLPLTEFYKVLRIISNMLTSYKQTAAGNSITALAMSYTPDSATTGKITFAHVGYQPETYYTTLNWTPKTGLTVRVNGAVVSPGVAVLKTDTISVTYTGASTVTFTLTDSQNYLVAGSIQGSLLATPKIDNICMQSLLCGNAKFVNLTCSVELGASDPEDGCIVFTNKYIGTVPFEFTKTDKNGAPLSGVSFALYTCTKATVQGHVHSTTATNDPGCCWNVASPFRTATSTAAGLVSFGDLVSGDYMLVETKTKAGYQLPVGQWLIHVDVKANPKLTITARGANMPPAFKLVSGKYSLPNYPSMTLPKTGRATGLWVTVIGVMLIGAAVPLWWLTNNTKGRKKRPTA